MARKPRHEPAPAALERLPVADLHADPANVRRHPDRNIDAIKASLARFGQQTPIVVDAANVVRKGNGTLLAARALGWAEIDCVRTGLKGVEATAYSVADNRTSELAEWDDTALAETLRALQSEPDFDLASVGFTAEEIDGLCAGLGDAIAGETVDDPAGEWEGMPEFEHEDLTADAAFIIRVFLKDEQDLAAFGRLLGKDLTDRKFVWFSKQPIGETFEVTDEEPPS